MKSKKSTCLNSDYANADVIVHNICMQWHTGKCVCFEIFLQQRSQYQREYCLKVIMFCSQNKKGDVDCVLLNVRNWFPMCKY